MQKKSSLILAQAILLSFIILVFGIIVLHEKGNIFLMGIVEKKITAYYQEHYGDQSFQASKLLYDKVNHSYYMLYTDLNNKNHNFKIIYQNKKVKTTYEDDYVKGKELLKMRSKIIQKEWDKIFQDTMYQDCQISFYDLDQYQKKSQEEILNHKDLKSSGFYQVKCFVDTSNSSEVYSNELFKTLDTIATANSFLAKSYTLNLKDNGIIKEVTKEKGEI